MKLHGLYLGVSHAIHASLIIAFGAYDSTQEAAAIERYSSMPKIWHSSSNILNGSEARTQAPFLNANASSHCKHILLSDVHFMRCFTNTSLSLRFTHSSQGRFVIIAVTSGSQSRDPLCKLLCICNVLSHLLPYRAAWI